MALGALEATKHTVKLPIFGVDALPEALQLIKKKVNLLAQYYKMVLIKAKRLFNYLIIWRKVNLQLKAQNGN